MGWCRWAASFAVAPVGGESRKRDALSVIGELVGLN